MKNCTIKMLTHLLILSLFFSCSKSAGSPPDSVKELVDALNQNVTGETKYFAIPRASEQDGHEIIKLYEDRELTFYAVNMAQIKQDGLSYVEAAEVFDSYVTELLDREKQHWVSFFTSANGYKYFGRETGLEYSMENSSIKDLEKMGALIDRNNNQNLADLLASEFGLSEVRAVKVARLSSHWSQLSKSRSMTEADADAFSEELLGVNINEVKEAYKLSIEGDSAFLDGLFEQAADLNGTSPEAMRDLMDIFVK